MSDEETYEIPLQDQRVFGAGIKRKRVKFVPSSSSSTPAPLSKTPAQSVSALYLNLVLPKDVTPAENGLEAPTKPTDYIIPPTEVPATKTDDSPRICDICALPLHDAPIIATSDNTPPHPIYSNRPPAKPRHHEASLAHQVCLAHSHPPSHLDRTRKGLSYLSSYGWDPDSRLGLGAMGQGIAFPIKAKPKDDKLGIGVVVPKEGVKRKAKVERLDAGRVRKKYENEKRKDDRLRELFYRNEDVERYLGGG